MRLAQFLTLTTALVALPFAVQAQVTDKPADPLATPHYGAWGIDLAGMDTSVKPGDNFFDYVNGKADAATVIPADQSSYGVNEILNDLSEARSKAIVEDLAARTDLTGDDAKIAALYNSMMDEAAIEKLDIAPLVPELRKVSALKTKADMATYMGATQATFGSAFFGAYIAADEKNPRLNVLHLGQSGLGLPDRDYYLDEKYADKKAAYETYVTDMLRLIAYPDAAKTAHDIVALETRIAEVSWTRAERRDSFKTYNPMKLADLDTLAPGFGWKPFLKAAGVASASQAIVSENTAFPKIAKIYADTPLDTLKAWEAFKLADQSAPYLSKRFVNTSWEFKSHKLRGATEQRPRWKRAIGLVEGSLGEALGRDYVALYFPPESKAAVQEIVKNFEAALKTRIENLTWMSDATKQKALYKLSTINAKIGYPDKWRDYSALDIRKGDLYGNADRSNKFEWNFALSKLDKPVDPTEWGMTPQTVNAYYDPSLNEICLPAAELAPPFFDPQADMAVNYGGIGASTIGHEITHGFDDEGRNYDASGKLDDWWTEEDSAKFDVQGKKYAAQFDTYEPIPGMHIKGDQTLGENIADLGGVLIALDAYRLALKGTGVKDANGPIIDGYTGDQRLMMSYAQSWRGVVRDETTKMLLVSDVHSPYAFRVIGPMQDVDAWYTAFDVKPGDTYYLAPEDRVKIW